MNPGLELKVENTIAGDGSEMAVSLAFNSMEDFSPEKVVEKIAPLKKLKDTRDSLRDLMTKVDRSEQLEELLENILQDNDQLKQLSDEVAAKSPGKEEDK